MSLYGGGLPRLGRNRAEVFYRAGEPPLKVAHIIAERESRFEPISYWMRFGDDITTGIVDRQLIRLKYGLRGIIPDGALMRVSTIGLPKEASYQFCGPVHFAICSRHWRLRVGSSLLGAFLIVTA